MPYTATDYQVREKPVKVQLSTWVELQAKATEYARIAELAADPGDRDRLLKLADTFGTLALSEATMNVARVSV